MGRAQIDKLTMFCAMVGPIPGKASSSSAEAVLILIRSPDGVAVAPAGSTLKAGRRHRGRGSPTQVRYIELLTVLKLGRQI